MHIAVAYRKGGKGRQVDVFLSYLSCDNIARASDGGDCSLSVVDPIQHCYIVATQNCPLEARFANKFDTWVGQTFACSCRYDVCTEGFPVNEHLVRLVNQSIKVVGASSGNRTQVSHEHERQEKRG